jgi:hypothetical protein
VIERVADPSAGQSAEEITAYYREAAVGDSACIRTTYGGALDFRESIVEREAKKSRIVLKHAAWNGGYGWYVDGRNCQAPGGKAKLVKPTPEIEEWKKTYPLGAGRWGQRPTGGGIARLDEEIKRKFGIDLSTEKIPTKGSS